MYDQTDNGEFTEKDRENVAENAEVPQEAGGASPEEGEEEVQAAPSAEAEENARLKEELQQAQAKANEYLDGWQRARAEFANYKKRVDREQANLHQTTAANIMKRYLEILDDLDRALRNRPQEAEDAKWAAGIELIYRKLLALLESEGITVMDADGKFFDPNLHEGISQEESSEHESGQIIEVVKNGYMMGDRVLRPALVRVAR